MCPKYSVFSLSIKRFHLILNFYIFVTKRQCGLRSYLQQGRFGLFVKSSIPVKIISDVEYLNVEMLFEMVAVEIEVSH